MTAMTMVRRSPHFLRRTLLERVSWSLIVSTVHNTSDASLSVHYCLVGGGYFSNIFETLF